MYKELGKLTMHFPYWKKREKDAVRVAAKGKLGNPLSYPRIHELNHVIGILNNINNNGVTEEGPGPGGFPVIYEWTVALTVEVDELYYNSSPGLLSPGQVNILYAPKDNDRVEIVIGKCGTLGSGFMLNKRAIFEFIHKYQVTSSDPWYFKIGDDCWSLGPVPLGETANIHTLAELEEELPGPYRIIQADCFEALVTGECPPPDEGGFPPPDGGELPPPPDGDGDDAPPDGDGDDAPPDG